MGMILVTGGTGYLGRHLVDSLLSDGAEVRLLVYSEWKGEELEARGIPVWYGDVTEPDSLVGIADGVDTVYHLVGGGNDGRTDPFKINTEGTRNLMQACRQADLKAFVYVSSSSIYGRQEAMVDELSVPAPRFDYPQSKLDAERLLLEAAEDSARPLPAKIVRMAGIYGLGAPMIAVDLVRRGQLRITGDGLNHISVIHVEDAVRALRAVAERGRPGSITCLGDDEPVQPYTFHNHFAELIGAPPVQTSSIRKVRFIIGLTRFLSRMVGRRPPLTEAVIEMSTLNVRMDNRRMREELGVALSYPSYREGLAQCAAALYEEEE